MATPGPAGRGRRVDARGGMSYDMANMANKANCDMVNMATMARVEATMATIQSELRCKEVAKEEGAKKLKKKIKDKENEIEELEKRLNLGKDSKDKDAKEKTKKKRGRKADPRDGTKTVVAAFETLEKQLERRRKELEERKREVSRGKRCGFSSLKTSGHLCFRDIDSCIQLAELEADIERDTLHLLDMGSRGFSFSFVSSSFISGATSGGLGEIIGKSERVEVRANLLRKEDIDLLLLDESKGELLLVNGKTQDDRDLVLELGGRGVVGVDSQGWARLRPHLPDPCPAVTARIGDKVETDCSAAVASSDIQGGDFLFSDQN